MKVADPDPACPPDNRRRHLLLVSSAASPRLQEEAWISPPLKACLSTETQVWDDNRLETQTGLCLHPGFAVGGLEQTSLSFSRLIRRQR